ncbi:hypothetical protein ND16A_3514 [Thalassotalea sp. ND16A]|nr:hypothetical protein ND16A_3514 [Thalassotalea sp. ND16A]
MSTKQYIHDVLIIGGVINGVGIALDAVCRGLKVTLCEMNDLASATSSNRSKSIYRGLRFRLQHQPHLRPAWMILAGLFLYDQLSKGITLPGSKGIKFPENSPLVNSISKGFEYSDAWVDDVRLAVSNAMPPGNRCSDKNLSSA